MKKKLVWDKTGERLYETGVSQGVLYPIQTGGVYNSGTAWNGLSTVTESPSGAEPTAIYADNIKYLNLMSAEEFSSHILDKSHRMKIRISKRIGYDAELIRHIEIVVEVIRTLILSSIPNNVSVVVTNCNLLSPDTRSNFLCYGIADCSVKFTHFEFSPLRL